MSNFVNLTWVTLLINGQEYKPVQNGYKLRSTGVVKVIDGVSVQAARIGWGEILNFDPKNTYIVPLGDYERLSYYNSDGPHVFAVRINGRQKTTLIVTELLH